MNPYESRKLARRIHVDRARRIESILVRLTAEGTLSEDKYRAERELADDLAVVLSRTMDGFGHTDSEDWPPYDDAQRVLARHKAAMWEYGGPIPKFTTLHKVHSRNYVWCDVHGAIHEAKADFYDESQTDCMDENWRSVFVATTDPAEEF